LSAENRHQQFHPFGVTRARQVQFVGGEAVEIRGAVFIGRGGEQVAERGVLALGRQLANAFVHRFAILRLDRRFGIPLDGMVQRTMGMPGCALSARATVSARLDSMSAGLPEAVRSLFADADDDGLGVQVEHVFLEAPQHASADVAAKAAIGDFELGEVFGETLPTRR